MVCKHKSKNQQKTIIVLGAPRSGTSMAAGILSLIGVNMGNLRKADSENPKGYFEDKDFLSVCTDILKAVESKSNGFNVPDIEDILKVKNQFNERIESLLFNKSNDSGLNDWGWKVTTTCFTIELFSPFLRNPYFIVILRNPYDIAKSMVKYSRNKPIYKEIDLLEAFQSVYKYYNSINSFLSKNKELPRHFISYEDIVSNPIKETRKIAQFIEVKCTKKNICKVKKFVNSRNKMRLLGITTRAREKVRYLIRYYPSNLYKIFKMIIQKS